DRSKLAEGSTHTEVISVDHLAVGFDLFALDADVRDPVLAAAIGAAGDVQLDLLLKRGKAILKFLREPSGKALGLGEGEFAELGAGAGDSAAGERRSLNRKPGQVEFLRDGRGVLLRHIGDEQILHDGGAQKAVGVAISKIGSRSELVG